MRLLTAISVIALLAFAAWQGRFAPSSQKLASISDALPPAGGRDQGRGLQLEEGKRLPVTPRRRKLDDFDRAAGAIWPG